MARTDKPKKDAGASTKNSRPYTATAVFGLVFVALSAAFLWLMRVETALKDIPVGFLEQVESKTYANGTPIRTRYTGIAAIDSIYWLVAAFVAGPLSWDEGVRVQQMHFLVQFFAVVAIWNVEACRVRHSWRLISFTALFALSYQTIGGAVIVPLYYLTYVLTSTSDTYYTSGRAVPLPYARGMLFSYVVGFLIPTLAMYTPGLSAETAQLLTFIWQPAPVFVNILLFISSLIHPSTNTTKKTNNNPDDVKHLKRIYSFVALVCALSHVWTMHTCLTSKNPKLSLSYVFLPNRDLWTRSSAAGLHYIFQVDWWGCFAPTLLWCWITVYDVHRLLLGGNSSAAQLLKWAVYIVVLAVVIGPGATLALVWNWREDRLVMIESGVRGAARKPKTA